MTLDAYQAATRRTWGTEQGRESKLNGALGLAGEAGEVVDLIKKHLGHGHPLDLDKLKKELGDVLWYVADLARQADFSLDDVATANIAKLKVRYPEGFSEERSRNRGEG